MPTQHVHTLEWLAAKKYAALCVTGMVDHHIQYISTFPHEIRKKILFFVQRTSVDEAVLCSLLSPGDVRTLDFSSVPMSTNVDFSRVLQLCPLLTSLNISNWKLGKIPEILRQSLTLKSINVGCSINFQDSDLIAICQSCPNLTYLDLSRNDSLSDVGIVALASTCTQLVGLKITYVDGITETGLHRLLETCTNLETLNIKGGSGISSVCRPAPSLTSLNAKSLSSIKSHDWQTLLRPRFDKFKSLKMGETAFSLPQFEPFYTTVSVCALQELDISWNAGTTEALVALLERSPYLTKMKARACEYVNDAVVVALAGNCPRLEHLNIARGCEITDGPLSELAKVCVELKDVDISWSKATNISIGELLLNCTRLKRFSMAGCKQNVLDLRDHILALNGLIWLNLSWVNSCSAKFAQDLVNVKTNLCVSDYYGEEIRGIDFHEVR